MKKILFAAFMISLMGVTYAQTTSVNAHVVYNYQASIRRLNANYFIGVANGAQAVAERYSVVSDTIQGYIVIPRCYACDVNGVDNFRVGKATTGTTVEAFVTRVGDTVSRRLERPFVFRTTATYDAGVFGAYVALTEDYSVTGGTPAPLQSSANINQAWMRLDILSLPGTVELAAINPAYASVDSRQFINLPSQAWTNLNYGFYGLDNWRGGSLLNAGFGTVISTVDVTDPSFGWCGSTEGDRRSCQVIQSITGTTIGDPTYYGACGATPMWDLCYRLPDTITNPDGTQSQVHGNVDAVHQGAVSGTWVLSFDSALSRTADNQKVASILTRMGVTNRSVQYLDLVPTFPSVEP